MQLPLKIPSVLLILQHLIQLTALRQEIILRMLVVAVLLEEVRRDAGLWMAMKMDARMILHVIGNRIILIKIHGALIQLGAARRKDAGALMGMRHSVLPNLMDYADM